MSAPDSVSGFILVGGQSTRMGQAKALLPWGGGLKLAQRVALELAEAAGYVCLVGDPEAYGTLGWPVVPDHVSGRGPLSGIEAALASEWAAEWNLIVACDMPHVDRHLFQQLAEKVILVPLNIDCVVPREPQGKLQPLCAMYRRRCRQRISEALAQGTRRVVDAVAMLQASFWDVDDRKAFQNVNTPPEWNQYLNDR